tara:strand:+ start:3099 stop:4589 length:1491 start_codon:yes stop_codon:yes gene_type:complete
MFEDLATGLHLVLTIDSIFSIVGGVAIGIVVGALPGMSGTMGVALALPFTFYMQPVSAILLLLGLYKGAIYGGSISAILINTPGMASSACTVLDGYPMARAGKAGKALKMALYASCIADFISNLALILLTGLIAGFALRFGPPEFFSLICFSLTIIAGVSGASVIRGLVSAGFGLILATIGIDIIYGTERFIFGNVTLMGGLGFIPVLIGLFAIPEILNQLRYPSNRRQLMGGVSKSGVSLREMRDSLVTILRGSVIGVVLGAVPGIGPAPAAFLSYSEARRSSRNPEQYGKGELNGIAASESGNNGAAGATMIPLLSLGVPGDVVTAVILGAFMVHGLSPGPIMFQDNIHMIYALYIGILISSVCILLIALMAIRVFARVADLPNGIVFPTVLVLCVYGCYAVNNSMTDLLVMMIMGIVGFGMLRFDIPAAPFLIAFVLGPLFEDNFRRSILLGRGEIDVFFRSEITWVFYALTAITLWVLFRRILRDNATQKKI